MTATGLIDQLAGALRAALEDLNINVTLHIVLEDESGQVQQRFDDVLRRMLATPPSGSRTSSTAPADSVPGARDDNKPEPACGGAGNGKTHSTNAPKGLAGDYSEARDESQRPRPPAGESGAQDPCARLRAYIDRTGCSIYHVVQGAGVAWATVRKIVEGENVSLETQAKIREFLDAAEDDSDYEPNDDPDTLGSLPHQPSPRQAAAWLQRTVATWMRNEGLNHERAAAKLSIPERMLVSQVLQVKLPTENALRLIAAAVPEIRPSLPSLLRAKRMETNGAQAA